MSETEENQQEEQQPNPIYQNNSSVNELNERNSTLIPVSMLKMQHDEELPHTAQFRMDYLKKYIRVLLDDGRIVFGHLRCLDKDKNIVLSEATQVRRVTPISEDILHQTRLPLDLNSSVVVGRRHTRGDQLDYLSQYEEDSVLGLARKRLGFVMLPGEHVLKVEVCTDESIYVQSDEPVVGEVTPPATSVVDEEGQSTSVVDE
eukprot:TRINITY_DN6796_c0_g1_i1.p1 TRINITY_DN6796_c0_g1~~TRINITY_DN6796_c0_g1_i1.p1  ORF type:complete len:218 (-),score=34.02 TRINITY_DN6796_c0_g1_i1:79-687(-)